MADVKDVAQCILEQKGEMTTWKLQKLVYYCQAWSLVWDEKPLFDDRVEAWANGPVVPALYEKHKGQFRVSMIEDGDSSSLSEEQKETIDAVLETYGDRDSHWLSNLTHMEAPWADARKNAGLGLGERGDAEITQEEMAAYYDAISAEA